MNITFANDFLNKPNQAYIALSGDPEAMICALERTIREIQLCKKPVQGIVTQYGAVTQIITPTWNGQKY